MIKSLALLGTALFSILPQSCQSNFELEPLAIARPEDRRLVQTELDKSPLSDPEAEFNRSEVVAAIDEGVGHSNWGWSCSLDIKANLRPNNTAHEWTRPTKEENFEAALKVFRSDRNFLQSYASGGPINQGWPDGAFPNYEQTIDIIGHYYTFTVEEGLAFIGHEGRYVAFNPPLDPVEQTRNITAHRCQTITGACVEGFFVSKGMLYPTFFRDPYINEYLQSQ